MQEQLWNAGPITYKPRGWRRGSQSGPCQEPGCNQMARPAQGARYCATHSRSAGHNPGSGKEQAHCPCGRTYLRMHRTIPQTDPTRAWHDQCPACRHLSPLTLSQLRTHHVPYDQAMAWLSKRDTLECELCGRTLGRKGGLNHACIDHNHACCPHDSSCGSCIRGVVCSSCNTGLGQYERMLSLVDAATLNAYSLKGHFYHQENA